MSTAIIPCKTLENELLVAMERVGCKDPVLWLEQGLHNWPGRLRSEVQRLLDGCVGGTVLLAMSLCGNAVAGLETGAHTLVIPRCDDCVSLLLGGNDRRRMWPDAYFLTRGWMNGDLSLMAEYRRAVEKYGEKRGKRIFSAMLQNYRRLALVDTGCFDADALAPEVSRMAGELGLEPIRLEGSADYLTALLTPPWPEERFLIAAPHSRVLPEFHTEKGDANGI